MRISAQLIDATSGAHLWADRFDGSLADIFDLQDKVASTDAGVIDRRCRPPKPPARPTAQPAISPPMKSDVVYLEVGDRRPGDDVAYPDDDLAALWRDGRRVYVHTDGRPY